jgi:hypothetical protein
MTLIKSRLPTTGIDAIKSVEIDCVNATISGYFILTLSKLRRSVKHLICFLLTFLNFTLLGAQQNTSKILSQSQTKAIFTDSIKKELKINYPIFRVYKYADKSGEFLCVLTESNDSIDNNKDTFNHSIKAINLKVDKRKLIKVWELNDNIIKNGKDENSIWFWTSYFDFKDFDNDGLVEPIIVYGTRAMNDYDDGRIKFIIFYKGQKIAIRHQNGVLDDERKTQIDNSFYSLPKKLKDDIKAKMTLMEKQKKAIFTATW